jgi:uncharacterized membrane protein required for colicin V production
MLGAMFTIAGGILLFFVIVLVLGAACGGIESLVEFVHTKRLIFADRRDASTDPTRL